MDLLLQFMDEPIAMRWSNDICDLAEEEVVVANEEGAGGDEVGEVHDRVILLSYILKAFRTEALDHGAIMRISHSLMP